MAAQDVEIPRLHVNQSAVFPSDNEDTTQKLPRYLSSKSEDRLNYFRNTMLLRVMR